MTVLRFVLALILCLPIAYLAVVSYVSVHNQAARKSGRK